MCKKGKASSVLSLILVVSMIMMMIPSTALASSCYNSSNWSIKAVRNDSFVVNSNEEDVILHVEESDSVIRVTLKNEETGEVSYFEGNKRNGDIYSSETKQIVNINELILENESFKSSSTDKSISSSADLSEKEPQQYVGKVTKKISYKKLSTLVTATSSAASIAGAIITVLGLFGITVISPIPSVVSIIGGIVTAIQIGIGKKSSKHGVKVTMRKYKYKRYRGGKVRYYYRYRICAVGTY